MLDQKTDIPRVESAFNIFMNALLIFWGHSQLFGFDHTFKGLP